MHPSVRSRLADLAPKILSVLGRGRENGKKAQALEAEAGVEREWRSAFPTRKAIGLLIQQGHPIVSDPDRGYWLAESPEELDRYADALDGRAQSIQDRAEGVRCIARRWRESG